MADGGTPPVWGGGGAEAVGGADGHPQKEPPPPPDLGMAQAVRPQRAVRRGWRCCGSTTAKAVPPGGKPIGNGGVMCGGFAMPRFVPQTSPPKTVTVPSGAKAWATAPSVLEAVRHPPAPNGDVWCVV